MLRWLVLSLLLGGCTMLSGPKEAPVVAAHDVAPSDAALLPPGFLDQVGASAQDPLLVAQSAALAAEAGSPPVPWSGDDASGSVAAGPLYMVNVKLCRDLRHVAERDGNRVSARATLCRLRGGGWQRIG